MNIQNKIIVIGGNHPNTLGLIRSIGENGIPVILMLEPCSTLEYCCLRFSKYIQKKYFLKTEEEILEVLNRDFSAEHEKPIILCASDAAISLLDAHYDELKDRFSFFNAGEQGRINHFMDKANMLQLADECGLTTIKTWYLNSQSAIPEDLAFPCFVKASNSAVDGKVGIGLCDSREELVERLQLGHEFLVQEFVEKEYELCINGFSYNHGNDVVILAACRKIRDYTDRQSMFMVLEDIAKYPCIDVPTIKEYVKTIGYEGVFSVEFLCKEEKCYFLEINMRNDGINYLYTAAGMNIPYLFVKYAENKLSEEDVNGISIKFPTYIMHHQDFADVIHHRISAIHWLKDLMRTRAFFVLNWRDSKPFIYTMWMNLKLVLRKLHLIH